MRSFKRMIATLLVFVLFLSTAVAVNAETNEERLKKAETKLQQNANIVKQKEAEKQSVSNEMGKVQKELQLLEIDITKNKEELDSIEQKITETNKLIEKKKEEIVVLQDRVLAREGIMKKRLVSLQHNDRTSLVIKTLVNSDNFTDFVQRATAVTTIINADKNILEEQQKDLKKIEDDKKEIDAQEQLLEKHQESLSSNQANLEQNLQKRQTALTAVQTKYNSISQDIAIAEKEKASIQSQIHKAQNDIKREQERIKARAEQIAKQKEEKRAALAYENAKRNEKISNNTNTATKAPAKTASSNTAANTNTNNDNDNIDKGDQKGFYVTATAYSHEESTHGITSLGYNIKKNPNMKLIAVDPSVIPLGKKVWVEGYGEAIAGDTGGAIVGHKIDVLMPSGQAARQWGRKTVKVIILN
ncbi:3D domain-containing protein [Metabacillus fastidiosus]|uniref:3D domain-containing protein n=1 Tax=Metabacillus fastidiosus TaxID=1458 RepID=UPI002E1D7482|nr:3D domain-containing protein [Metabacillus fastidiosus]MED4454654.1 3D domain-containing protein [Metabacillus fastidiosus]